VQLLFVIINVGAVEQAMYRAAAWRCAGSTHPWAGLAFSTRAVWQGRGRLFNNPNAHGRHSSTL